MSTGTVMIELTQLFFNYQLELRLEIKVQLYGFWVEGYGQMRLCRNVKQNISTSIDEGQVDLRIMLIGSSSSLIVRQWGKALTVYKSEVVPQACLPCYTF